MTKEKTMVEKEKVLNLIEDLINVCIEKETKAKEGCDYAEAMEQSGRYDALHSLHVKIQDKYF